MAIINPSSQSTSIAATVVVLLNALICTLQTVQRLLILWQSRNNCLPHCGGQLFFRLIHTLNWFMDHHFAETRRWPEGKHPIIWHRFGGSDDGYRNNGSAYLVSHFECTILKLPKTAGFGTGSFRKCAQVDTILRRI